MRYMFLKHIEAGLLDVSICCLGKKGEFGKKIERMGYKIKAFNRPYRLWNFPTTFALYRHIMKNNFDIVHSSLFYANYHSAIAARMAGIPKLIIEEHGEHSLHFRKRHFFYWWVAWMVAKMSSFVICCSHSVARGVKKLYRIREEKIIVLKNLAEDKRLEIMSSRNVVRIDLDIPPEAIVIGTVSSIYWVKNQNILIDIIGEARNTKFFLIIAGDGPLRTELEAYAREKEVSHQIRFLGWREDVADILNALDIFVLPSLSEGLPICLLEAMSMGLPCIASKVGGIEEILEDGVTGITVTPGDFESLNTALQRVVNDTELRLRLGRQARIHILHNFEPSLYVKKVLELYQN